ncbi:MAG: TSUP family transporter [Oceanospirillaceae bacterium]
MELLDLSVELIAFLFVVSIIAGLIDTLAGGGGLIVLPALIMCGIPPLQALGTNKLQGTMGTLTATFMMFKNKKVEFKNVKLMMLTAFLGAVLGTIIIQWVDVELLSIMIPIVLLFIGFYFLLSPSVSEEQRAAKLSQQRYQASVVPIIGCYDGMFGPGTGSFFALAGVSMRGFGLIKATAQAKPLNFATNLASLLVFIAAGQVIWAVGLFMMVGQVLGAWLGAHCLFIVNPRYIKAIVVVMCFSMLLKYAHSMGWLDFLGI